MRARQALIGASAIVLFTTFNAACGSSSSGGKSNGGAGGGSGGVVSTGGTTTTGGVGGTHTGGTAGTSAGGAGATCTTNSDCTATTEQCVSGACKKVDGQPCTSDANCVNRCVSGTCSSLKADGANCTADSQCEHTCIAGKCAPTSAVGGPCDTPTAAGGAGGGGGHGGAAGAVSNGGGGHGGAGGAAPGSKDCATGLACTNGKCLTTDGGACVDNVDCVNTCIGNVCAPKTNGGPCDTGDNADCPTGQECAAGSCRLSLAQPCTDNTQCASNKCICSDANCTTRTCKTAASQCLCRWSPSDSTSCNNTSAVLNAGATDPNGCDTNQICSNGNCVAGSSGTCTQNCATATDSGGNTICAATTVTNNCNVGYAPAQTSCTLNKTVCDQTCQCVLQ